MTPRQAETLEFIRAYQDEQGYSPAYTEIMAAMGWKSKSRVHAVITALSDRGFIRFNWGQARSVEILTDPHGIAMQSQVLGAIKAFRGAGYPLPSTPELADYLQTDRETVEAALVGLGKSGRLPAPSVAA